MDKEYYYYDVTDYRLEVGILHDEWYADEFWDNDSFEGFLNFENSPFEIVRSNKKIEGIKEILVDWEQVTTEDM